MAKLWNEVFLCYVFEYVSVVRGLNLWWVFTFFKDGVFCQEFGGLLFGIILLIILGILISC